MTGYTVHTGASKKFVSGWDRVFGDSDSPTKATGSPKAKKAKSQEKGGKAKKKKK